MGRDRHYMRARAPWGERVVSACWHWLTGGWHWRATVVLLCVGVVSMMASVTTSGPVQLAAQAVFTALVLAGDSKQVVQVVRDLRAHDWTRLRRVAWLQYPALVGGVLITLVPGYGLLVFIYPTLQSSPMTRVAVALAVVLLVLALALLALTLLALLVVLLWVPVLIVRSLSRERRRRSYHHLPGR
jgi:hypothetical protein